MALNATVRLADVLTGIDEPVAQLLMIPLAAIVLNVFTNGPFQRSPAKEDYAVETFEFQSTEIPLPLGVQVWPFRRQDDGLDVRVTQDRAERFTELCITAYDQILLVVESAVVGMHH
ncbi:MAG: hypothetical protein O3A00_23275 [Planctomycetota bacterium]|nr:hypothetical protein [Planctomycetota bacterium]